ncbi:MAG: GNAT family N-acetyltransferase [Chloroflexota bacterium]
MSTATMFTIETVDDQEEAKRLLPQLIEIYRAAFREPPYNKLEKEVQAFAMAFPEHCSRRGFKLLAARADNELVGFVYGYDFWSLRWIYKELLPHLNGSTWLESCYQIVEFAVLPAKQGKGLGRRLHDGLLERALHYERYLLITMAADTRAMHLYAKRGWEILLDDHQFPGVNRLYRVLGKTRESQSRRKDAI